MGELRDGTPSQEGEAGEPRLGLDEPKVGEPEGSEPKASRRRRRQRPT